MTPPAPAALGFALLETRSHRPAPETTTRRRGLDARRPLARTSPEGEGAKVRDLEKRLAESLERAHAAGRALTESREQRAAMAEILRVMASSRTDVQPVFDAILASAVQLCGAENGGVFQVEGELIHSVAASHFNRQADAAVRAAYPRPVDTTSIIGRAILERRGVHVPDLDDPAAPQAAPGVHRAAGFRSQLSVPMLRDGEPIGGISVTRAQPGLFSNDQIALLHTFADQAVMAVENVRLFKALRERNRALEEALEQQTATSEILRVTSESLTDVQPTFQAIAMNATRLCDAVNGFVFRFDGELIDVGAYYNVGGDELGAIRRVFPIPPGRGSVAARAILTRAIVHVADLAEDPEYAYTAIAQAGFRTVLGIPMLRDGIPIGAIVVTRMEVAPFSQSQIELLQTFARQALIAVENVRLFQELQARTRDLGRSVEELKALVEVSRAVSSTLDLETVLHTIVTRAVRLTDGSGGVLYEYDASAQAFSRIRGAHGLDDDLVAVLRATPLRLGEGAAGKAAVLQAPVQVADVLAEGTYDVARIRAIFERQIVGVLVVWRRAPESFAQEIVDLLQTMASQSVLAIQNARLFREIEAKSRQLEVASQHKSEFLANMSHELRTPLNAIIGFSEVLTERMFGELNDKQDEYLRDIYASGQHLLSLINDILDLSKIEAGRMELEPTDFDLPGAIDHALAFVRERAARRGITLGRAVDERVGAIRGDERKVKQIVLNLLSNAIKFTPEGGRIDVRATVDDGVVKVAVTDTGVGIAPEDQEAVFEEFRPVGAADKKVEGTGLGLALSRKFVELHGGRIGITSELGHGSTFTFTLPVRRGG